jgi:hypothetical protein
VIEIHTGVNMGKRPHRLALYQQSEWFYNHKPVTPVNSAPQQFNWCVFLQQQLIAGRLLQNSLQDSVTKTAASCLFVCQIASFLSICSSH